MRLLVVEDNLINQQVARELLKSEGAHVDMADNGLVGVTAVAQAATPFNAVLMDLQMPVMDGFAATRAIRNELRQTELPIIAMTANAMASDREECLAAGMNDHIGKPFDLDHLVSVLLKHTGSKLPTTAPVPAPQSTSAPAPVPLVGSGSSVIQAQQAIDRIGGMKPLYASLLREFLVDLDQVVPEYQRLLAASLFADAARHMHTLKGTSATLGALELSALALDLEKKCKSPADARQQDYRMTELMALIESTNHSARQIISELEESFQQTKQQSSPAVQSLEDVFENHALVSESVSELMGLLSNSDLAALDQFSEMRPNLDSSWSNEVAAIDTALSRLDFDAALDACRHLEEQLRTSAY
jgi:CheY-like chemotaxis protein